MQIYRISHNYFDDTVLERKKMVACHKKVFKQYKT